MLESTRREMHGMVAGILEEQLCGCTEDYTQLIKLFDHLKLSRNVEKTFIKALIIGRKFVDLGLVSISIYVIIDYPISNNAIICYGTM